MDITVDSEMDNLISDLQRLIRQPSVSARKQGITQCASLVASIMNNSGIGTEILYLDDRDEHHSGDIKAHPVVYGEVKSKSNPDGKTILFYNHYDVQPEDPIDLWSMDPFSGIIEGNYVFGRGASDDKGELITRIKAVEYFLRKTGDVPCNVKFIVEGEEEIGSEHISQYLKQYKDKFACDGIIWEFGYIDEKNRPIISLGMKGLLYIELLAKGPIRDAHSSLAVLIENPAWVLVRALNSLRDESGSILVKDWYNEVRELTSQEISLIEKEPFDEESFRKEYSIEKFVNNNTGVEIRKALVGHPTCNIAGILSGYTGEGAKTVLPAEAIAKVDFRLVPNMIPEKQFERIIKHLRINGFGEKDIIVKFIHGEAAARVSPT
ncbi:MAG TPA: M20/M25/M40 family metallo-hydrolase, partial [Nitrososphaeraceae archaeon]|nr:M20/M25/M40 family metallo-hydrolase [Nitrososphaeraceae archaeon]